MLLIVKYDLYEERHIQIASNKSDRIETYWKTQSTIKWFVFTELIMECYVYFVVVKR